MTYSLNQVKERRGRVLLAMRPGAISMRAIEERFGHIDHTIAQLQRQGLICKGWNTDGDSGYQLTPAGLAACPKRRDIERPSAIHEAIVRSIEGEAHA